MPARSAAIRAADLDDVHAAAELLIRARLASPHDRLLGSATTTGLMGMPQVAAVLTPSLSDGYVSLAVDNHDILGVACWIEHPPQRPSGTPAPPTQLRTRAVQDLLDRLDLLDLVLRVPAVSRHRHLAYLGTRPGYGARAVTDALLHHQGSLAARNGHLLAVEAHTAVDRDWLHRRGYQFDGVSLGDATEPLSYAMSRAGNPALLP